MASTCVATVTAALTVPSALLRWAALPVALLTPLETAVLAWVVVVFVRTVALTLTAPAPLACS